MIVVMVRAVSFEFRQRAWMWILFMSLTFKLTRHKSNEGAHTELMDASIVCILSLLNVRNFLVRLVVCFSSFLDGTFCINFPAYMSSPCHIERKKFLLRRRWGLNDAYCWRCSSFCRFLFTFFFLLEAYIFQLVLGIRKYVDKWTILLLYLGSIHT